MDTVLADIASRAFAEELAKEIIKWAAVGIVTFLLVITRRQLNKVRQGLSSGLPAESSSRSPRLYRSQMMTSWKFFILMEVMTIIGIVSASGNFSSVKTFIVSGSWIASFYVIFGRAAFCYYSFALQRVRKIREYIDNAERAIRSQENMSAEAVTGQLVGQLWRYQRYVASINSQGFLLYNFVTTAALVWFILYFAIFPR